MTWSRKESDRVRVTNVRTAEGGICQDREGKQRSEDSPVLTLWRPQREGGHAKCFGVGILEIIGASQGIVGASETGM